MTLSLLSAPKSSQVNTSYLLNSYCYLKIGYIRFVSLLKTQGNMFIFMSRHFNMFDKMSATWSMM